MAEESNPLVVVYTDSESTAIVDSQVSGNTTWSSSKIQQELDGKSSVFSNETELKRLGISAGNRLTIDGVEQEGGGGGTGSLGVPGSGEISLIGPIADLDSGPFDPAASVQRNRLHRYNAPSLVEYYGAVSAKQLFNGLGFNMSLTTSSQEWAVRMAKEAGATTLRWQPAWDYVENMQGTLALTQNDIDSLHLCVKYDIKPILVAAYGSPRSELLTVTLSAAAAAGTYTLSVSENVSSVTPLKCFIKNQNGSDITDNHAYYGSMIDTVDTAAKTITLASKTNSPLPAGSKLVINQLRYAPIFSTDPNDSSVAAYCRYVRFLAQQITDNGLSGQVELWNEPVWMNDRWDAGPLYFDRTTSPNYNPHNIDVNDLSPRHKGILFNLMNGAPLPDGVTLNNGATHISGFNTVMQWIPTSNQIAGRVVTESFHPYGRNPEDFAWYNDQHPYVAPQGITEGGNLKWYMEEIDALNETDAVIPYPSITETGLNSSNQTLQSKFLMRQFLLAHSLGFKFVNIYAFGESEGSYSVVDPATQAPRAAYNSLKDLVANRLAPLSGNTVVQTADYLPRIASYSGTWPLAVVPVLGSGASIILCAWQRTYGDFTGSTPPQATPEQVTIQMMDGSKVSAMWDTVTLQPVAWTQSGNTITFPVSDNPVAAEIAIAVPITNQTVQSIPTYSRLPNGATLFPFWNDSRSTDLKAAFYDASAHNDQHLAKNRFVFDSAIGRYVQILSSSKAHNLRNLNRSNWGWGAWIYIPDGLGNEVQKSLYLVSNPNSGFGSVCIFGTRFARIYGLNGTGNPVEASSLNGVSTYPFRGKWRHVFCSWGSQGTRMYIDGQLHAAASNANMTDEVNEPFFNGNTTDDVFMRDLFYIPYQPSDAEIARWASPNHRWLNTTSTSIDASLFIPSTLTPAVYPQTWISPYFFTLKNISAFAGTAPSSNMSIRVLKNGQQVAALTMTTSGSSELLNQAIPVNAADRLSIQIAAPASGSNLTIMFNGD